MKIQLASEAARLAAESTQHGPLLPGLGLMGVGLVMTVAGVRRNELKKKAGLAVMGLIIILAGAMWLLYGK